MGKEKFPFHKLRTALPEASSIHLVQCHSNTSVWSHSTGNKHRKSIAHTLLWALLPIEELIVMKIIRWNNITSCRGEKSLGSNPQQYLFLKQRSKIITIIPQNVVRMRTKVLWIGFNQGMNGRTEEPGHTLIHAHALLNHSI